MTNNCRKCRDLKRENNRLQLELQQLRGGQPQPDAPAGPPTYIATPMQIPSPNRQTVGFRNPWNNNPARDI